MPTFRYSAALVAPSGPGYVANRSAVVGSGGGQPIYI